MSSSPHLRRIALLGLMLTLSAALVGCGGSAEQPQEPAEQPAVEQPSTDATASQSTPPTNVEPVTELKIEEITEGTGALATSGKNVTVHYTGWLTDGTKFDSSLDAGQPFTFALGAGEVIPGWDKGVEGMKVGGKRRLTIPPDMAYGEQGVAPVIPGNATLVFDVELLEVQ